MHQQMTLPDWHIFRSFVSWKQAVPDADVPIAFWDYCCISSMVIREGFLKSTSTLRFFVGLSPWFSSWSRSGCYYCSYFL